MLFRLALTSISLSLPAPSGKGLLVLAFATGAGVLALWPFRRTRRSELTGGAAAPRPRLMLLNLPPVAESAHVEHAPPLGSQPEVRAQIEESMPGIIFDEHGVGTFTVRSGSVEVDVRREEPVYTVVVTVHGNAGPAVARLLDETGWRAFAPRIGAFVSALDLRGGRT